MWALGWAAFCRPPLFWNMDCAWHSHYRCALQQKCRWSQFRHSGHRSFVLTFLMALNQTSDWWTQPFSIWFICLHDTFILSFKYKCLSRQQNEHSCYYITLNLPNRDSRATAYVCRSYLHWKLFICSFFLLLLSGKLRRQKVNGHKSDQSSVSHGSEIPLQTTSHLPVQNLEPDLNCSFLVANIYRL